MTPCSLARGLHRGHTVEGLVAFLEKLAQEPLHPAVLSALYAWAEAVEALSIAPALLLRVRDPALLQELSSIRRLRARLGETLSARVVTVEADQLEALVRHLERLGFYPRIESAAAGDLATAPGRATAPGGFAIRRVGPGLQIQAEQVATQAKQVATQAEQVATQGEQVATWTMSHFRVIARNKVTKQSPTCGGGDCFVSLAMTEGFANSGECLQSNVTLSNYSGRAGDGWGTHGHGRRPVPFGDSG